VLYYYFKKIKIMQNSELKDKKHKIKLLRIKKKSMLKTKIKGMVNTAGRNNT
jgi:hypothetical protein